MVKGNDFSGCRYGSVGGGGAGGGSGGVAGGGVVSHREGFVCGMFCFCIDAVTIKSTGVLILIIG